MKKLLVLASLLASTAHAGRIKEVVIMATEDVEYTLHLLNPDLRYKILTQGFTTPAPDMDTAVQTTLEVRNLITGQTKQWTCTTQFVKTATFFDVYKTDCN